MIFWVDISSPPLSISLPDTPSTSLCHIYKDGSTKQANFRCSCVQSVTEHLLRSNCECRSHLKLVNGYVMIHTHTHTGNRNTHAGVHTHKHTRTPLGATDVRHRSRIGGPSRLILSYHFPWENHRMFNVTRPW